MSLFGYPKSGGFTQHSRKAGNQRQIDTQPVRRCRVHNQPWLPLLDVGKNEFIQYPDNLIAMRLLTLGVLAALFGHPAASLKIAANLQWIEFNLLLCSAC